MKTRRIQRLLITGASGLLGLNVAMQTAATYEVVGVVNMHPYQSHLFKVLQRDLLRSQAIERLLDEVQPDAILNCAALADVDSCERQPELALRMNVELPARLAAAAVKNGIRFVHISSDTIFDGKKGNYGEEDEPHPLSIYAKSKLQGERAVLEAMPKAIVARTNLIGWSRTEKRSLAEFFFYNLQAGLRVNGFKDVFFCPLLATDLAFILVKLLESSLSGLFHVFSCDAMSKIDFGVLIARRFGFDEKLIIPLSVQESGLTALRSQNLTMNTDKLQRIFDMPLPTVVDAIEGFYVQYVQGYSLKIKQDVIAV